MFCSTMRPIVFSLQGAKPFWCCMESSLIAYIGAVISVVAVIISMISYRRVSAMKSLDLRLEAHRARNNAHTTLEYLKKLREEAINSRKAVASATGMFFSGAMKKWQGQWDQDEESIKTLSSEVPGVDVDYVSLGPKELETKIVALHRTQGSINTLTKRYEDGLQSDEAQRNRIREDHRAHPPDRRSSFDKK